MEPGSYIWLQNERISVMREQLATNELYYLHCLVELEVSLQALIGDTNAIPPDLRGKLDRLRLEEGLTAQEYSYLHSLALRDGRGRGRGLYKHTEVAWGRIVDLAAKLARMHDELEGEKLINLSGRDERE
jgi:hypothetical protein